MALTFDPLLLPKTSPVSPQTLGPAQQPESQLAEKDTKLTELLTGMVAFFSSDVVRFISNPLSSKRVIVISLRFTPL